MFGELGPISQTDPQFYHTLDLQYGQISDSVLSPSGHKQIKLYNLCMEQTQPD